MHTLLNLLQVLEQVSPKVDEVICKAAKQHPDRNRSAQYLPGEFTLNFPIETGMLAK